MRIKTELCIGCGLCANSCPSRAIILSPDKAQIDSSKCTGCQTCALVCPTGAIEVIHTFAISEVNELKAKLENIKQKADWIKRRLKQIAKNNLLGKE